MRCAQIAIILIRPMSSITPIATRKTPLKNGVALAGPSPATLVDPIPVGMLRQEILEVMNVWGQEILAKPERYNNRFYQTFIVLSYCRMLHSLHTGTVGSKGAGAEWAKSTLDPAWAGLMDRTWDGRPNPKIRCASPPIPKTSRAHWSSSSTSSIQVKMWFHDLRL